ncbi:ubiquitin-conjugating enzyme/RWD-like protein, partial [Thamnocephalis sphaerospora]
NLRNPKHCPPGIYMMPGLDDMDSDGYYRGAVFKFKLAIPEEYPNRAPSITFITDVFHPLVDPNGRMMLRARFPRWEAHRDHIFHVLRYLRDAFRRSSLDRLDEAQCPNREALQMYKDEPALFAKLAQQCSGISTKDSILYDNYPESNSIRFTRLTDVKHGAWPRSACICSFICPADQAALLRACRRSTQSDDGECGKCKEHSVPCCLSAHACALALSA